MACRRMPAVPAAHPGLRREPIARGQLTPIGDDGVVRLDLSNFELLWPTSLFDQGDELAAARAANCELMAQLNSPPG